MSDDRSKWVPPTHTRLRAAMTTDETFLNLEQEFPAEPSSLPMFRAWFRRAIGARLEGDRLEQVVLAAHEIASNAAEYGTGSTWTAELRTRVDGVEARIVNEGQFQPAVWPPALPDVVSPGGRGLFLAAEFSDRLDHRSSGGVVVITLWFEFAGTDHSS